MPRLIDDLRAPGACVLRPYFVPEDKRDAWQTLAYRVHDLIMEPDLPVLLIDNVAEYYYSSDQEYWSLDKDFPNLAPPYPIFWCECKMAKRIHSKEKVDTDLSEMLPQGGRLGMLITGVDQSDVKGEGIPENARWVLWCELFIDYNRRGVTADGPHGSVFLCIDAQGAIINLPTMQSFADESLAPVMKSYMTFFHPAFLAVCFLHCKNVSVIDNVVDAPLAKKYRERHGITPCSYKTLVIEPLKAILRKEGRSDQVGLPKAMHICRGHFADYTQGRGLFGKYHGKFYIPATVRGTKGKKAPPRELEVKVKV